MNEALRKIKVGQRKIIWKSTTNKMWDHFPLSKTQKLWHVCINTQRYPTDIWKHILFRVAIGQ